VLTKLMLNKLMLAHADSNLRGMFPPHATTSTALTCTTSGCQLYRVCCAVNAMISQPRVLQGSKQNCKPGGRLGARPGTRGDLWRRPDPPARNGAAREQRPVQKQGSQRLRPTAEELLVGGFACHQRSTTNRASL